jgi:thiamine-phosphate pyrophosphorylase
MHKFKEIYYYIDNFNRKELINICLKKKINLIYRNYNKEQNFNQLNKLRAFCKNYLLKLYISNDIKLAIKLKANGLYIPSFNKKKKFFNLSNKKFKIIGSAHNVQEVKNKIAQGCSSVILGPIFKTQKSNHFLDVVKFNLICSQNETNIISLGGINEKNFKRLLITKSNGFASISWIKKNGLNKI